MRLKHYRAARNIIAHMEMNGYLLNKEESLRPDTKHMESSRPVRVTSRGVDAKYFPNIECAKGYLMYRIIDGRPMRDVNVRYITNAEWQDRVRTAVKRVENTDG